jgi:chromosome segregation ATPase
VAEIRTTGDLLRALRDNPEWREAVRNELLGDRLQTLPELVSENSRQIAAIGEKVDRAFELLGALTERMDRVDAQIAALTERMDRVDAQIAALTERMDRVEARLERVEARLERVEGRLQRVEDRLGRMEGRDLEREILSQPRAFVRRKDMIAVHVVSNDERYDISARLPEQEENELDLLDVILEGMTSDGVHAYIAVEASITPDVHDIQRAHGRALLLAKATGAKVLPLVICEEQPLASVVTVAKNQQVALAKKQLGIFAPAPLID